eukprot:Gb_36166 [translate_table: standard]
MSHQFVASMKQIYHQTHVAQQSRRNKLRILGLQQHPQTPQSGDHSEHSSSPTVELQSPSQQRTSENFEHPRENITAYPRLHRQSNIGEVQPVYYNHMLSSDNYNFSTGAELLAVPAKNTCHLQTELVQQNPALFGTIYSGQSLTPASFGSFPNAQSKTGSWGSAVTSTVTATLVVAPSTQTANIGSNNREETMATYFPGSNIQTDNMQTLYLMNPGYAGYTDATASGNMVLLNHSVGNALAANNLAGGGQSSQHFIGIPLPTAPLSQRPSVGVVGNSPSTQQDVNSNLLASRLGSHQYNIWRNGGNELTFMQTVDATPGNQSLSGQVSNSVSLGHQSVAEISQLGVRRAPMSSIQEQQSGMLPSGLSLQLEHPHGSTGHGQGLSLSLSPQQPSTVQLSSFQNQSTDSDLNCPGISQATSEENINRADRSTSKWAGSLSAFRASSRDGLLGSGFSNSLHGPGATKQMHLDSSSTGAAGLPNSLTGSKYLKAAQQLLDEVVNVGKGIKPHSTKHQKSQTWSGTMANKDNSATDAGGKDGATAAASTWPSTSVQETNDRASELTPAERQELQIKKAKLVAMLEEVDHRYRQYYHQMQIVVSSFEAAAGFGAAKTYTSLALQTISRHFRCLRDAITGQIRLTSKSLGDEDSTGSGKGETSRLRFVDQQLRQQRALQQLGMIQQHAWRPQRGLPERSVSVLRAWLFEHFLHPYPKDADKHMLARQTGLTRSQVSNWFINARVRLWKPMVEEMYVEETKEGESERPSDEKIVKESGEKKEESGSKAAATGNSGNGNEQKHIKNMRVDNTARDAGGEQQNGAAGGGSKSENISNLINVRNQSFGMVGASDGPVFHEVENEGIRQGQLKKARNGTQDSTALLSQNMSIDVDLKSEETNSEDFCDNSKFNDERHNTEDYSLVHNAMVHPDNSGSFGSYQIGDLSRYGQQSFTPRFSGSGGVSLTLGLQHTDGLSLSGTQQSYISSQSLGSGRRHDLGSDTDDYCNMNETSAVHPANAYENINMQNRKRFATQLLHDFVA